MKKRFIKNVGFEYFHDNNSIIVQLLSITKENVMFDEKDLRNMITITGNYFDSVSKKTSIKSELFGNLNIEEYDLEIDGLSFYKFIKKDVFENYYKKGKFQLGSIQLYREIENNNIRDEKEGFSNLLIRSNNRHIFTSVISGYNHYIFCGTDSFNETTVLTERFGDVCVRIKNVKSFAEKIKKSIGAKSWQIKKVTYSDFKAYSTIQEIKNLNGINPDLSDEFFKYLIDFSFLPSVYCKPLRFSDESEIRITFDMGRNVKKKLHFDNLGLLEYFEVIK